MKWHWNEINQECEEFHYGGCLGNGNRFDSKQQYMNRCAYETHRHMLIREGYYNDDRKGHWWYYFNATDGDCHRFFYYGCGGNDNRFYSHYHCKKVCGERLAPDTACDRCDVRTSICIIHSKYNYACECREGFAKNAGGECVDLDECRIGNSLCNRNARCVNTVGSYTCKCNIGYSGDGKKCAYVGIDDEDILTLFLRVIGTDQHLLLQILMSAYHGLGHATIMLSVIISKDRICASVDLAMQVMATAALLILEIGVLVTTTIMKTVAADHFGMMGVRGNP
ncbi:hypothetical protein WUBG_02814 [Wuchereria bancrofti]|uniref:EGF-like domain-containing protein n=1 Tax=Wuchereria bancrofti TaxID=6293 RepID=J9F9N2_WUCBA|nr:hypothetical protein WUBG_02814 [Wuchereria bancrofti]